MFVSLPHLGIKQNLLTIDKSFTDTENKIVNVRFPEKSFQPVVPSRLSWSRNYAAKDIELKKSPKVKDCSVIEESFLTGFMQQVKNPTCEPDEYGIKYLPVMHQAMCIEGRKVGRTAANEDKRIDVLLTEVMEKVGKEGLFIIYDEEKKKNELKFLRGMKLNWGAVSSFFIDDETQTCVLKNPKVLINENKISKKIVKQAIGPIGYKQPLFIIAEDVEVEVAGSLILDRICVSTKVVTAESNSLLARLKLGSCKEVVISDNEMVILGGSGSQADIEKRCEQLRSAIKASTSDYEIKLLEERLLNLSCGALIVKVTGGSTKNKRIVNALNAVKAAMEGGIIPENSSQVCWQPFASFDLFVYFLSLAMPVCTIASAAGVDGSAVAEKLLEQDNPDVGYDPARGEYVDVIKLGIFDPMKLVIKELDDAISYFITHCWCSYEGEICGAIVVPWHSYIQPLDVSGFHQSKCIQRLDVTVTRYYSCTVAYSSYEMLQRQNGKIDGMGGS
ncbi:60 kDa chaperonin [Citrus sinensis]|nr:60 kDa chaperonin [Citrus sinensis]